MMFRHHPIHLVLGLTVWAVWFVIIYSLLSIGCAGTPITASGSIWINIIILCFTLLVLIALVYFTTAYWQTNKDHFRTSKGVVRFIIWVSLGGYLIAIIALFSIGIMVLFFPPCL